MIIHAYILKRDMTFEFNDCKANLINNPNLSFSLQSVGAGGVLICLHIGGQLSPGGVTLQPPPMTNPSLVTRLSEY